MGDATYNNPLWVIRSQLLRRRSLSRAGACGACAADNHPKTSKTPKTTQKGQFWAFQTSKIAIFRAHRRPKQTQNASDIHKSAPDILTYIATSHMYQNGPKHTQKHSTRPVFGIPDEQNSCSPGPQKTNTASKCPKHTKKCFKYHIRALLPVTCCIHTARKSLNTTIWHYMAHFGALQTSNMAVIQPSGSHNSLRMPRTYPKVLQIPPMGIPTSHMLHPYGLEIAQKSPKMA